MNRYPKPNDFDIELAIATKVFKLQSLHYGYWLKGEEMTINNLHRAQKRYTDKLLQVIPKSVKKVADVGAGLGDISIQLAKKGFDVTTVSPDPLHKETLSQLSKKHKNIKYINSKFEHFSPRENLDLILFSESGNYILPSNLFDKTAKSLRKNGYLLISDIYRKSDTQGFKSSPIYDDFIQIANEFGFELKRSIDITEQTAPTLEMGGQYYKDYVIPFMDVFTRYYKEVHPLKTKLAMILTKFFLGDEVKVAKDYFLDIFSAKKFQKYAMYKILLFQLQDKIT